MYKTLSDIQKKYYLELSGENYENSEHSGTFMTSKPYNNEKYKLSPWIFSFIFNSETGYLICELTHRMTNNRIYGWDYSGNELTNDILHKYFKSDEESLKIISRK